jgi:hypothetical protein
MTYDWRMSDHRELSCESLAAALQFYGSKTYNLDTQIAELKKRKQELFDALRGYSGPMRQNRVDAQRKLKVKEPTHQTAASREERISELLEILWNDVTLWQLVQSEAPPEKISKHILGKYDLDFPPLSPSVWREMVLNLQKRDVLMQLLGIDFATRSDKKALKDLRKNLPPDVLVILAWKYLRAPGLSQAHVLASLGLDTSTLLYLGEPLLTLKKDVDWCHRHPGMVPKETAPRPQHRLKEVKVARLIEKLVKRLVQDGTISDYELSRGEDGVPRRNVMKHAATARRLAKVRERAAVEHYAKKRDGRTVGRKPSSRG